MRHRWILVLVVWMMVPMQGLALEGLFTLKVKNHCENNMDIFIDGSFVGTVEQEGEFLMVPGTHWLFAKNTHQFTDARVNADQNYDWILCQ